jgi:hypothetical protein
MVPPREARKKRSCEHSAVGTRDARAAWQPVDRCARHACSPTGYAVWAGGHEGEISSVDLGRFLVDSLDDFHASTRSAMPDRHSMTRLCASAAACARFAEASRKITGIAVCRRRTQHVEPKSRVVLNIHARVSRAR